ncbi:hypothetical protein [Frondihabitans australicus]|uniref:hypothetical protein n=1 Tax=Frondihabitans australicus TaxID=386892 RepID=UPI0011C3F0F1|nr:hypothetical protein [Frondihabitans australicus]
MFPDAASPARPPPHHSCRRQQPLEPTRGIEVRPQPSCESAHLGQCPETVLTLLLVDDDLLGRATAAVLGASVLRKTVELADHTELRPPEVDLADGSTRVRERLLQDRRRPAPLEQDHAAERFAGGSRATIHEVTYSAHVIVAPDREPPRQRRVELVQGQRRRRHGRRRPTEALGAPALDLGMKRAVHDHDSLPERRRRDDVDGGASGAGDRQTRNDVEIESGQRGRVEAGDGAGARPLDSWVDDLDNVWRRSETLPAVHQRRRTVREGAVRA